MYARALEPRRGRSCLPSPPTPAPVPWPRRSAPSLPPAAPPAPDRPAPDTLEPYAGEGLDPAL